MQKNSNVCLQYSFQILLALSVAQELSSDAEDEKMPWKNINRLSLCIGNTVTDKWDPYGRNFQTGLADCISPILPYGPPPSACWASFEQVLPAPHL